MTDTDIRIFKYLAIGDGFKNLSFQFYRGDTTIGRIVKETTDAIWEGLQPLFMPIPNEEIWKRNAERSMEIRLVFAATTCLAIGVLGIGINYDEWVSPCPRLFIYDVANNTRDTWFGIITLLTDIDLSGVWLRILLDQPSLQLGNYFGEVKRREGNLYGVSNRNFKLKAHTPKVVNFFVKYDPDGPVPRLVGLFLNARMICPEGVATTEEPTTTPHLYTSDDVRLSAGNTDRHGIGPPKGVVPLSHSVPAKTQDAACGKPLAVRATPLILDGQNSFEGEWPWHVAIYRNDDGTLRYICGGSVLTRKFIITAAHCVTDLSSGHKIAPTNFLVYAGTANLKSLSLSTQTIQITDIHIHPQFSRSNYYNDIALLETGKLIDYDNYVKPVCLWEGSDNLSAVVNHLGTVVGWGLTENDRFSKVLKKVRMPIVSNEDCIYSKPEFYSHFLTSTKYCAGHKNGSAACNGDSGSGMVLSKTNPNGETVWHLRGLVSIAKPAAGKTTCDPFHLVGSRNSQVELKRTMATRFVSLFIVYYNAVLFATETNAQTSESPCPRLFAYEPPGNETDKWYGFVTLLSETDLSGVWLRLILDRPALQLGTWFGEVKTGDNKEYLIKNRNYKLAASTPNPVRFYIKYDPNQPIPRLVGFRLNAKTVCPEVQATAPPSVPTLYTSEPGDVGPTVPTSLSPRSSGDGGGSNPECGTVAIQPSPLILYGQKTQAGEFPWHAAIYNSKDAGLNYICGGSLISRYHVISAAHCVSRSRSQNLLDPENLIVYLGKHYLKKWSDPGIQQHQASRIIRHPQYNSKVYSDDIAIVRLSDPVEFNDFVRPVCLWEGSEDFSQLVGKLGTVAGWGFDENGKLNEELTKLKMPTVSKEDCIYSFPDFFSRFTTSNTFCAGFTNGTSVCNGDSGDGLVFPKNTGDASKQAYQLRGLVSVSVALQNESKCDPSHYVVFTDVAKYLDFIKEAMAV
ncbi:hypothetical protein Trydic_g9248 [Trypoxylus dichotomus]